MKSKNIKEVKKNGKNMVRKGAAITIVIVLAIIGGTHLYADHRVTKTLDQTIQATNIVSLAPTYKFGDPTQWNYDVFFKVENPTSNTVKISLSNIRVSTEGVSVILTPVRPSPWKWKKGVTIHPGDSAQFIGSFSIFESHLSKLQSKEKVLLQVNGSVKASVTYLWIEKTKEQPLSVDIWMFF